MKGQAMHLIQRTPSRGGSLAGATTTHAISDQAGNRFHPPVKNVPRTLGEIDANPTTQKNITHSATTVRDPSKITMRRNDTTGLETPVVEPQRPLTHITTPSAPIVDALNVELYTGFYANNSPRIDTKWPPKK